MLEAAEETQSATAAIARGRAMIAADHGDLDAALRFTEDALGEHELIDEPFQRARTLLVRGGLLRRAGQPSAAKSALTEARTEFDRLGSPIWSERAAAELRRIPGRRR
jgi:hypothetical protein